MERCEARTKKEELVISNWVTKGAPGDVPPEIKWRRFLHVISGWSPLDLIFAQWACLEECYAEALMT